MDTVRPNPANTERHEAYYQGVPAVRVVVPVHLGARGGAPRAVIAKNLDRPDDSLAELQRYYSEEHTRTLLYDANT
ncbi:hypothetical protein [Saccharopolyspora rhizosphaerae]|uniref:hypothetical protein n=1 Tax=Saccharopolyspora rhizosphaerae TaxID=2492662 RepID=UPI00131529BC